MSTVLRFIAAVILFFHGLVHLMGTVVYMKLGTLAEFPYKTTILGGVDLGTSGIYVFGMLWALAAIGFVMTAVGLIAKWNWNTCLLVVVSTFSLVLAVLDWPIAYTGVLVNIVILGVVTMRSRLVTASSNQAV